MKSCKFILTKRAQLDIQICIQVLFNNVVVCDPQEFMFGHEIEQKQDKLALQAAPYITLFFKIHRQMHIKKEKNHQNIKLRKTSTIYHLKNPSKNTLQFFFIGQIPHLSQKIPDLYLLRPSSLLCYQKYFSSFFIPYVLLQCNLVDLFKKGNLFHCFFVVDTVNNFFFLLYLSSSKLISGISLFCRCRKKKIKSIFSQSRMYC